MRTRAEGFTVVELLVVLVIGAIVLGATFQTLTTQEKSNRQQIAIVTTQQNVRTGVDILMNELREASATDGDILEANTQSIRFRAMRKAGVVCGRDGLASREWADVAIIGQSFASSDSVVVFADSTNKQSARDDTWKVLQVISVSTPATCTTFPVSTTIQRLRFPSGSLAQVDTGALVRSYDNIQFSLVNRNGRGYIVRTQGTATDTLVEYLTPPGTTNPGLRLRYFNVAGTEITPSTAALRATIMRIEIKVVGMMPGANPSTEFTDSLVGQLYLRGNNKAL